MSTAAGSVLKRYIENSKYALTCDDELTNRQFFIQKIREMYQTKLVKYGNRTRNK